MFHKFKYFIFSENPDALLPFYRDVLGFPVIAELKLPLDYGYMVQVEPGYDIWIAEHSEVKGYNKDPYRHILNLYTPHVREMYDKVKDYPGVKILQEPINMSKFNPDADRLICTILDPEGNCLQFMQPK